MEYFIFALDIALILVFLAIAHRLNQQPTPVTEPLWIFLMAFGIFIVGILQLLFASNRVVLNLFP
jgi:hypothetical protein